MHVGFARRRVATHRAGQIGRAQRQGPRGIYAVSCEGFDGSKTMPGAPGGLVERDVSFAGDIVRGEAFGKNPNILAQIKMKWDETN